MLGVSLFASFYSDKRKQIAVRAKHAVNKHQKASTSKDESWIAAFTLKTLS